MEGKVSSVSSVGTTRKCPTCRGYKQMPGMGGLWRECWGCDGKGTVSVVPVASVVTASVGMVAGCDAVTEVDPNVTIVTDNPIIEPDITSQPVAESVPAVELAGNAESVEPVCMFPGYSDMVMTAILDEPKMSIVDWKQKYRGVTDLFLVENGVVKGELIGLRDRQAIRLAYGQSKPPAPRKVDLMKSQDMVASRDADYMLHVKNQEKLAGKK